MISKQFNNLLEQVAERLEKINKYAFELRKQGAILDTQGKITAQHGKMQPVRIQCPGKAHDALDKIAGRLERLKDR